MNFQRYYFDLKRDRPGMRLGLWTRSLGERSINFAANSANHEPIKHMMFWPPWSICHGNTT